MPIGMHHTFADPQVGAGFKFIHSAFTALVAIPTLLTVFTICASVEIAGRLRGGKGPFGWIATLPWDNPIMLAVTFSFIMLGFGGAGGLINMSYQLDATIHNTQWITGHFHLIFGGAIVIMYFAIAYDLWPHLTGRQLTNLRLMRTQLWLWFIGMIVTTFPWHWVGILGMPRRMAYYDYSNAALEPMALSVSISVVGAFILVISAILFFVVLLEGQRAPRENAGPYRFAVAVHPPIRLPEVKAAGLWDAICSAAGIARKATSTSPVTPDFKISSVVVTPQMLSIADTQSIGRGATLAHQCAICHGPAGFSRADAPNLSGQFAGAIYKQLKDFQSGARSNAIMTPFAAKLTDQDMIDVASYYAYLPRLPEDRAGQADAAPRIVLNGAPLRNIPPCGSCHGSIDHKIGSPWLQGQPAAYIKAQLQAFARDERNNDISQQMRNIARHMTPLEIDEAARYYSSLSQPARSTGH